MDVAPDCILNRDTCQTQRILCDRITYACKRKSINAGNGHKDSMPRYHISTLLTAYGRSIRINTNGFDFALTLYSLTYFRRRLFEIQTLISSFRKRYIRRGTHIHVKVTQEVTVNLPEGWVPRRQRLALDQNQTQCDNNKETPSS